MGLVLHVLDALLTSNSLLDALPGPRVRPCPLAANRQVPAMPHPAITLDVLQSANVLLNGTAQLTLRQDFLVEIAVDLRDIIVGQFRRLHARIDAHLMAQPECDLLSDTVQVRQRNIDELVVRNIDTLDTRHRSSPNLD